MATLINNYFLAQDIEREWGLHRNFFKKLYQNPGLRYAQIKYLSIANSVFVSFGAEWNARILSDNLYAFKLSPGDDASLCDWVLDITEKTRIGFYQVDF
ncbi:hypothetical protein CINF_1279 [Candidatus Campylobacter infans]|uniref:Uncharacterized protein n=1 Tax=Candidatus Campylobacter infans TaxID=2561898 RepID=A0A7H9CKE5_9BACT|nr:hypothetical protein [Candidatus Campylobacter infans]QLI05765.1 hypothetical protein CINF_1279 [Candidatus Campylobacter infans]